MGSLFPLQVSKKIDNKFWIDVFDAWHILFNEQTITNNNQLLSEPLWFNPRLSKETLYFPKWYRKGIVTIADVLDNSGNFLSVEKVKELYSLETINPLNYIRIKTIVSKYIKTMEIKTEISKTIGPLMPTNLLILNKCSKGAHGYYTILRQKHNNVHKMKTKWENDLNISISKETWNNIFDICFRSVTNNNLVWFQLKILYRILGTNSYLSRLVIKEDNQCVHCKQEETLLHMLIECEEVKKFWDSLKKLLYEKLGLNTQWNNINIIFGHLFMDQNRIPINALLLVAKKYIYDCSRSNNILDLQILISRFHSLYVNETFISILNNKEKTFDQNWIYFKSIFN